MAYVCYVQLEDPGSGHGLLDDTSYVHPCKDWADVLTAAMIYIREGVYRYKWDDETVQDFMEELNTGDCDGFDLLNGQFFCVVEWDGEEKPLAVARRDDKKRSNP